MNLQENIRRILREETKEYKLKFVKQMIYTLYKEISVIEQSTYNNKPLLKIYFNSDDNAVNIESWFDTKISNDIDEWTTGNIVVCPIWAAEWDWRKKNADVFIETEILKYDNLGNVINESVLREESNKDILIDGLYDPIYEENGIVLFKEPKHLSAYSKFGIKKSNIISGKEFNKKYVDFNSKKLHKVLYKDGITLGGNLGEGKYWCSTEYCLSVYLGETHQSREYSKYVKEVVDFKLGDGLKILVKKYISDDLW